MGKDQAKLAASFLKRERANRPKWDTPPGRLGPRFGHRRRLAKRIITQW